MVKFIKRFFAPTISSEYVWDEEGCYMMRIHYVNCKLVWAEILD